MTLMMTGALGNEGEVGAKESAYHIAVHISNDEKSKKQQRLGKVGEKTMNHLRTKIGQIANK